MGAIDDPQSCRIGSYLLLPESKGLTEIQEAHNITIQSFAPHHADVPLSHEFFQEPSETEGDADDESVGSDEEIAVKKPFVCQVENCDFSHRSEWGIKKHYLVSRPFPLCLPEVVSFSYSGIL